MGKRDTIITDYFSCPNGSDNLGIQFNHVLKNTLTIIFLFFLTTTARVSIGMSEYSEYIISVGQHLSTTRIRQLPFFQCLLTKLIICYL